MPRALSEYEVENKLLTRLEEMQYAVVPMRDYADLLRNFREEVCRLNATKLIEAKGEAELSDNEFNRLLIEMEGRDIYESAKYLRRQTVLDLDNEKHVYLDFFSSDPKRNSYQVTRQVTMDKDHRKDVLYRNRYDVTILINGLPLVQIELKRPGIELDEAINQINRYRRYSFRGLFNFIQIFIVSNSAQTKYFANMNLNDKRGEVQNIPKSLAFYWTDESNVRINKLLDFTRDFLKQTTLTDIINRYMVIKDSEPLLMVMRPYQIYAVQTAMHRIIGSSMSGYVWHTTGSGKTLTSFKLATLLRDNPSIAKIFFLIDRRDLDDQTVDEYNSFEKGCVDQTESTASLIRSLQDSDKRLIITTIQKMAAALRSDRYSDILKDYKKKRVVFIIDECHRSQFGEMHKSIAKHFTKSVFIGFTGTPRFKENKSPDGRTTADLFRSGEIDPLIHKYQIRDAIADGNVLRFSVEYMRTIDAKYYHKLGQLDPEKLDDPDYCKSKKINIEELYHSTERMSLVADSILKDLRVHTNPAGGRDIYTAIFGCDCVRSALWYYNYMKEHNPNGYRIAAIFSTQPNGDDGEEGTASQIELEECMRDYNAMFGTSFNLDTFDEYRRDISDRLKQKKDEQIDLLIVVNMFLTGFDSKATNTLILDKNLVWHSLVQAYSRTNRVGKPTKQFGKIITYRNIKKAQDDALKLYSGDGNPEEFLLQKYEYYLLEYRKFVEALRAVCATGDDAGYIDSEEDQRSFILAFRPVARTLATLKTFTRFTWDDLAVMLDEDEFLTYKNWYLTMFDNLKEIKKNGQTSLLDDINFDIELVRTDRINVAYIIRLLGEIDRTDTQKINEAVDQILRELERSDNEKMRYKRDLMKEFIADTFYKLPADADIVEAYQDFEHKCYERDVDVFASEHEIPREMVSEFVVHCLTHSAPMSKEQVRKKISELKMGLLKTTRLINDVQYFIQSMYDKYTAEE